jgi:two-component system KDP operon response regulator KdpE
VIVRARSKTLDTTATTNTVLLVEDEVPIRRFLRSILSSHGFRVVEVGRIADVEDALRVNTPAALLLDLGLPDGDGLDLLRWIREWSSVPVIIISARDRERDKVDALDAGADDYVTKPFAPNEVLARVRVAIRHAEQRSKPIVGQPILECGPIRIDCSRHEVTRDGVAIHLTPIEFQLLALLMRSPGRLITYAQMMNEVLGAPSRSEHHQLRVHMSALRRKLEVNPARPELLVTETGVGYRICPPELTQVTRNQ